MSLSEVPAARVAVLRHRGPYDTIDVTYRQFGRWVAANAEPSGAAVRECYVVGPAEADNPDEYLTETHWPLRA